MRTESCIKNSALSIRFIRLVFSNTFILLVPTLSLTEFPFTRARLRLGENLAKEIKKAIPLEDIDVVMPIPDSSRPAAAQLAKTLNLPYREGFIKNRYVGRTFIMPGQAVRKKSVRQKLNAMAIEFKGQKMCF